MPNVQQVNTTDLRAAIELGCQTMQNVFNADDKDIPFFGSRVRPEARLSFSWAHSESHVPGRHLNALLNAEDALGLAIDEDAVEKHAQAARFSYSGALPLPLNRQELGGLLVNFLSHNVREGFHALYALTKFRHSGWARTLAEASITTINDYWDPTAGWDRTCLEGEHGLKVIDSTLIVGLARALGPLVKFYRATGYAPALSLALQLKEKLVEEFFTADGAYNRETFGAHTHSTTCVLSSLAQLAELTQDAGLMERVRIFYDNGLWQIRDELGWVVELSSDEADPDKGECNNTGDIVETALILGRWGYPHYYHDAERMVRCHLLPAQLRDVSFIVDPPNPNGEDGKRHVAARHVGAFGFPAPYGHEPVGADYISFNMDIVGGAVASLCEVYRAVTHFDTAGHWVNLLFDHETAAIQVESPYTHPALRVRVKKPAPLLVRLPPWVEPHQIELSGVTTPLQVTNSYLYLPEPPVNRWVSIRFPLATQTLTLHHRTRDIRVRLQGDAVVAMDNFGADLTFFDPIE
ncbi:MAG: hypothetical protein R3E79_30755 [Caldilineaceae bacterium]